MQSFFAYHFLQSLALALLNSLWQMAFLWIAYHIVIAMFKLKASLNFELLVSIQTIGFFWFLYTFIKTLATTVNVVCFESIYPIFGITIQEKLLPLIAVLYLFFVFVFVTKLIIQLLGLKSLRNRDLLPISTKLQMFIDEVKWKLDIPEDIQIKISTTIITPLTVGFIKPVILIPVAAINNLTTQQLETILLHELAHIKRNDYVINLFILFVNSAMFFNPFSKYIGTLIDKQRELSCDDIVLKHDYPKQLYAEALLNVARLQVKSQPVFAAMTAVNTNHQELKSRIKRILSIESEKSRELITKKQIAFSFFFGVLLFGLIGFININVKKVITDSIPSTTKLSLTSAPVLSNKLPEVKPVNAALVNGIKVKKKLSIASDKKIALTLDHSNLQNNRRVIEKGFQMLSKLATENNSLLESVHTPDEVNEEDITNNQNALQITPAVESHPTNTVQRFFVPATTKSPASIIIVTTTEKDNGKKIVTIEIEKGENKIQ